MTRTIRPGESNDPRDEAVVREILAAASLDPGTDERRAILAAASGQLEGLRRRSVSGPLPVAWVRSAREAVHRLARGLGPAWRTSGALVGIAALLSLLFLGPWRPGERQPRSAAVRSYPEHVWTEPGRPFPVSSVRFDRPY